MQKPSSENISQQDSNPNTARLSLQHSHKILITNNLKLSNRILPYAVLSANLTERIVSPNKFEGLVPGLDGLLELGVFEGGQNLLKFWPWCIA